MIKVTRFSAQEFVVNAELIEFVEATPDTVISLVTGKKILVREPVETVVERVIAYRREIAPAGGIRTVLSAAGEAEKE